MEEPVPHQGGGPLTFPTTPEAFIAYQEQLAGRKLSAGEKEVTAAWVECFNLNYEDGVKQDRAALEESLTKLDELMKRHRDGPQVHQFLGACRLWFTAAWKQGAERSTANERHFDRII